VIVSHTTRQRSFGRCLFFVVSKPLYIDGCPCYFTFVVNCKSNLSRFTKAKGRFKNPVIFAGLALISSGCRGGGTGRRARLKIVKRVPECLRAPKRLILQGLFAFTSYDKNLTREEGLAMQESVKDTTVKVLRPELSWDVALEHFLRAAQTRNLTPRTVQWYDDCLKTFAQFARQFGETPQTVSRETIEQFVEHLLSNRKWSAPTVNSFLRAVRAFFRWLVKNDLRADNPMANFPLLREPQPLPKALTDEQITALLSVFNPKTFLGLRNLAFISLLLDTGLRLSEALNLEVVDLNFTTGLIFVRHSKSRRERMVPMSPSLMRVLQKYLLHRAMRAQPHVTALWITKFGTPLLSIRCVQEIFQRAAKKAGISNIKVSPHTLRFTFVRKWLQSGGDSIVLQRILGHTTPIMTAYYARLFGTDLVAVHRRHSPLENLAIGLLRRKI